MGYFNNALSKVAAKVPRLTRAGRKAKRAKKQAEVVAKAKRVSAIKGFGLGGLTVGAGAGAAGAYNRYKKKQYDESGY